MNKIIFLDIDGVLNNYLFYQKNQGKFDDADGDIDERNVELLNQLIEETGAKVVITSTWRYNKTVEQLQKVLNNKGFKGEVIDKTPIFRQGYLFRGNEIYAWLSQNNYDIDFKEYVIFDDDSDMLYWQKDNFIWVDSYCGLTKNIIYRAKQILNK